jgi:hypothetical protein
MINTDGILTETSDTKAAKAKYKTTPAQDKKAWCIYVGEVITRLVLSGGVSAALTRGYDATENTPISEKEIVAAIVSNVVFFAFDNSKKGLLHNTLNLTNELPQTPMQVLKSLGQAIAVFVLAVVATYAIGKADLNEMMGLGLIVLAANLLKAVVEKAVNHFLLERPVVLLKEVASKRPLLGGEELSPGSSELGQAGRDSLTSAGDTRVHSDELGKSASPYGRLTDGNEAEKSSIASCWATLSSCLNSKGDNPHGTVSVSTNPIRS